MDGQLGTGSIAGKFHLCVYMGQKLLHCDFGNVS